jgi:hypothetical protein
MDPRTKPPPLFATDEVSWLGLSAGPLAWFAAHALNYAIVPWSCSTHHKYPLQLISIAALVLVGLGAYVAWGDWRRHATANSESEDAGGRAHFVGLLAFCSCLVFGLVLLMEAIAQFYFDPCQR